MEPTTTKKVKTGKMMSLLKTLSVGDSFYTISNQKSVQAYASSFKIKIRTEVVLIVENYTDSPTTVRATKVTIISKDGNKY